MIDNSPWVRLLIGGMLGVFFGLSAYTGLEDLVHGPRATRAPVIFKAVEVLNVGSDYIDIRIYRTKTRNDCPVVSYRTVIDDAGNRYPVPTKSWPGGAAHTNYVDIRYPLPPGLAPGFYYYNVSLTFECPEGDFHIIQPLAPFQIKENADG